MYRTGYPPSLPPSLLIPFEGGEPGAAGSGKSRGILAFLTRGNSLLDSSLGLGPQCVLCPLRNGWEGLLSLGLTWRLNCSEPQEVLRPGKNRMVFHRRGHSHFIWGGKPRTRFTQYSNDDPPGQCRHCSKVCMLLLGGSRALEQQLCEEDLQRQSASEPG